MRNNIIVGVGIGLIGPLLGALAVRFVDLPGFLATKPLSLYVIVAFVNLLLVRYCYRNDLENAGRGVVLVTFLGLLILIVTKSIVI